MHLGIYTLLINNGAIYRVLRSINFLSEDMEGSILIQEIAVRGVVFDVIDFRDPYFMVLGSEYMFFLTE